MFRLKGKIASMDRIFECKMCGQCCEGKGGIVASPKDLARLAAYLGEDERVVIEKYAGISNGKLKIRSGTSGKCVFFRDGEGCSIHPAKPDICRAWPFFRGNLEDPASFGMAKDFCPGIGKNVNFEAFVQAGLDFLRENGLLAKDKNVEANALIICRPGDC